MGSCHHSQRCSRPTGILPLRCPRGMVSAASGRYHSRTADLCAGETASWPHVGRCGAAFCGIIYGLRESEVAKLRLDDIDWEHDQLRIPRAKRREPQVYPLLPSVGRALTDYLLSVRRSTSHREIFLTPGFTVLPAVTQWPVLLGRRQIEVAQRAVRSSRTPQSEARLCGSIGCARVVAQRDRRSSRTSQHFCYPCLCEGGSAWLA